MYVYMYICIILILDIINMTHSIYQYNNVRSGSGYSPAQYTNSIRGSGSGSSLIKSYKHTQYE